MSVRKLEFPNRPDAGEMCQEIADLIDRWLSRGIPLHKIQTMLALNHFAVLAEMYHGDDNPNE